MRLNFGSCLVILILDLRRTEGRLWTDYSNNRIEKFSQCEFNGTTVPVESLVSGRGEFGIREEAEVTAMPCWFDPALARIGQKFARRSITQLMISHFLSLFLLVANPEVRRILYFTMRSDNPHKAWKRYTATILQVKLWYDDDIISSTSLLKSLQRVKNIHRSMGSQLEEIYPDFTKPLLIRQNDALNSFVPDAKLWTAIKLDLELSRQLVNPRLNVTGSGRPPKHLYNQYIMTMTQFSFMALPVLFPKQLLLTKVSDVDFQGYIHLWAGIGYALGMNESYILCKDLDLTSCRTYTMAMLKEHFVPHLYHLDYEAQVMLESLSWALKLITPPITIEFMILWLLEDVLGIPCPNVRNYSGPIARVTRYLTGLFTEPFLHWPGSQWFINFILRGELQLSSLKHFGFDGTNSTLVADRGFYIGKK